MTAAGRWASKAAPDINQGDLGFNNTSAAIGPVNDWTERVVKIWGLQTKFTRTAGTDTNDNPVVSVTTNCDDPALVLLARKNNGDYWSGNTWFEHRSDRRVWAADLACRMLEEGFVATGGGAGSNAIRVAMSAAASPQDRIVRNVDGDRFGPYTLTGVIAQIRGLRLIQSMAPPAGWRTKLGGCDIPTNTRKLLTKCLMDTLVMYNSLPRPPWDITDPPHPPWGPQPTAGHATSHAGHPVFVGEHSDLVWRALTETDHYGRSPLTETLREHDDLSRAVQHMIVAAALYDDTAERQLTTGLFDGEVDERERRRLRNLALDVFDYALNPAFKECRWTSNQQSQIRGLRLVVGGLKP